MMQKMLAAQRINMISRRCFASYNYSAASNSKVFLGVSKDGQEAGKLVFELYDNHSPALAFNFAALASGPLVGTSLSKAMPGYGVQGGAAEMVQGEDLLAKIEADSSRTGALGSEWTISSA